MTDTNQIPNGTKVIARPARRQNRWPADAIKGTVVGYTASGRVKVETDIGIRVFAAHNVNRRY